MKVYLPKLISWDDDMRTNVPTRTVIEQEPVARFSGLLDANGNKLMVHERTEPVGFVVFAERK